MIREAIDQYLADPDDASDRLARYRAALHTSFGVDRTDERGRARDPDGAQGSAGGEVGGPGHGGEPPSPEVLSLPQRRPTPPADECWPTGLGQAMDDADLDSERLHILPLPLYQAE